MKQQCLSQNIPVFGNAANNSGSTADWLNLTGEVRVDVMPIMDGMMHDMTHGMGTTGKGVRTTPRGYFLLVEIFFLWYIT